MITVAQFRTDFSEFADTTVYNDSTVNFWLVIAMSMLNLNRWGNMVNLGYELFAAHNLVIEALAQKTAAIGGMPGLSKGVISSESPGAVSVSYDTASALEEKAGHWNLTVYGTRFIRMARMFGAGPIQVGTGCGVPLGSFAQPNVSASSLALVTPTGIVDGSNFTFALPTVPPNGSVLALVNGLALREGIDYQYAAPILSSGATLVFLNGVMLEQNLGYNIIGNSITLMAPPQVGDEVTGLVSTASGLVSIGLVGSVDGTNTQFLIPNAAVILKVSPSVGDLVKVLYDTGGFQKSRTVSGLINGTNKAFVLPDIPIGTPLIFLNGDSLGAAVDFNVVGTALTLVAAPQPGDSLFAFF